MRLRLLLKRAAAGWCSAQSSFLPRRVTPLSGADEAYLLETQFRGTCGERLRPYLAAEDFNPADADALRRPDFHYLQTLSVATGVL